MKTRKPASDQALRNPITSCPWDHFLNIEALFRCMDCSPCLPISISFPPAERLNLIQTHWCVDNEGVTRSWERPSNSPHQGSGFFWVEFEWVALLRDACTHVSLWQPLPKSKGRHRHCVYYIEIQYKTFKHFNATESLCITMKQCAGYISVLLYSFMLEDPSKHNAAFIAACLCLMSQTTDGKIHIQSKLKTCK